MQYSIFTNKLRSTKTGIKDNLIVRPSNGQLKFLNEFTVRSAVLDFTDFRKLK